MINQRSLFVILILLSLGCSTKTPVKEPLLNGYDEALAKELGADQYGMKNYISCFLKPGKSKLMSQEAYNLLEKENQQYLESLVKRGDLVMLGYFPESKTLKMQLILKVSILEDAQKLVAGFPKVKEEILIPEFNPWYGPAAIEKLKPIHNSLSKVKI